MKADRQPNASYSKGLPMDASLKRLHLAAQMANLGIYEWHIPTDVAIWENDRMYELFGHTREDGTLTKAKLFEEYIIREDLDASEKTLKKALEKEGFLTLVCRIRPKNSQEIKWLEFRGEVDKDNKGKPLRITGVVKDITAQKNLERKTAVLSEISRGFPKISNVSEVFDLVSKILIDHLQISNCLFVEIDDTSDQAIISHCRNSIKSQMPDLLGTYQLNEFINNEILASIRSGDTVIVANTQADKRLKPDKYASLGIFSFMTIPNNEKGKWKYLYTVNHDDPRHWQENEIQLLQEVSQLLYLKIEQAKSEEKSVNNEKTLQTILRQLPIGVGVLDVDGNFSAANPSMRRYISKNKMPSIDPDQASKWKATDKSGNTIAKDQWPGARALRGETISGMEFEFKENQSSTWVEVSTVPLRTENGEIKGAITVARDVTENKLGQEKIRQSEAKLQMLFQDAPALITLHEGPEHRFIFSNNLHDKAVGNRPLIGKSLAKAMPELKDQGIFEKFDKVYRTGKPIYSQQLGVNLMGEENIRYFTQVLQPWYNDSKAVAGVMSFAYDITDQINSLQLLKESEQRLQLATTASKLGIFDFDIQHNTIEWDNVLKNIWGVDPNTTINYEVFLEGLHPDDLQHTQKAVEKSLHPLGDGYFEAEYRVINRKTKEMHWIKAIGRTFFNVSQPVKMVGTIKDVTDKKQAEAALTESENRYRNLFNTIDEGFATIELLYDKAGKPYNHSILTVNPAFEKHSGLKNATGKNASEMIPGVEQFWNNLYDEVIKTGNSRRVEHYSKAFDRWFDVNVSRIGEAQDHKVAVLFTDISHRKKTERALKESEQQFRLIADITPQMIWVTDAEGNTEFLNRQWYKYSGTKPGNITASEVAAASVHPDDAPKLMEVFNKSLKTGAPFSIEQRNRAADGTYRWFLNRGAPYLDPETGKILRWYGVSMNIHDIKLAEASLRDSEERMRLASEVAGFGTYEFNIIENTIVWSEEVYRLYDYPSGKVPSREFIHQRIHPDDKEKFESLVQKALNPGSDPVKKGTYRIVTSDGSVRWLRDVNKAFYSEDQKQVIRIIGTIHDITEIKNAEQKLLEASRHKDEFLAILAHELRNPLTPIKSAVDFINSSSDDALNENSRKIIDRQVSKLIRLIDDLMDVSRITRGKIRLQKSTIDLREALEVALETTRPLVEAARHKLIVNKPADAVYVHGDLDRLIQVITNLLTNAAKYTPEKGEINVTLGKKGKNAIVMVKDNGLGIEKKRLTTIFNMFQQFDRGNHGSDSGLGIGLSLVQSLVNMHNGSVSVFSKGPDKGSEFKVFIPLHKANDAANTAPASFTEDITTEGKRLLVVDDNEDIADLLQISLKKKSFKVKKAYNGLKAIEVAGQFKPEAAIVDIGLPDIDGYQVARELRKKFPEIILIAHTGWGQAEDFARTKEAGFNHHLVKPGSINKIMELINT